jgi:hypothetical protein
MPFRHTIDHDSRTLIVTVDGPITLEDIRRHIEAERRDAGLSYAEIIDARTASPSVSAADVRALVSLLRDLAATQSLGPTAVVVTTDYAYGVLRMLDLLLEDVCAIRPFHSMSDARRWLEDQPKVP